MSEMRVLTVRQPWAWAIIYGGKDVENRDRNIAGSYRGPVAIHAAAAWDDDAFSDPIVRDAIARYGLDAMGSSLTTRAIIGVVDLVDVREPIDVQVRVDERTWKWVSHDPSPWAWPGRKHLVFADPHPLAHPIPFRGGLGLRRLPAEVAAQIYDEEEA
jgi:hypothetical protein